MAHFAQLDENNYVTQVIVINNNQLLDQNNQEQEQLGIDFCKSLFGQDTNWVQTSYNSSFRYNYAGIGFYYDSLNDAFIEPQPFDSWNLDAEYKWQAPINYPNDNKSYYWDETILDWQEYPALPTE